MSATSSAVAGADWRQFQGERLSAVIDQLYSQRLDRELDLWEAACEAEGVSDRPDRREIKENLEARWWVSFSPAAQCVAFAAAAPDFMTRVQAARQMIDLLFRELPRIFGEAILPLVTALHASDVTAEGIAEPEHDHHWAHSVIPNGIFRYGRWGIYRNSSRLVSLDVDGRELDRPAYSIVRLSMQAPLQLIAANVEPAPIIQKSDAKAAYQARINEHLINHNRYPSRLEDENWGASMGLSRDRVRQLRRDALPTSAQAAGRPPNGR